LSWIVAGLAACFIIPWALLSEDWVVWFILLGITAIAVLGLHILTGLCGQFSMGQAALMAVGAYTAAVLGSEHGDSPWATLPLAGIFAGLAGLLFGTPALRIKGFYLVMSTIAAQFIVIWVLREWETVTGGVFGIAVPAIKIGGEKLSDVQFWWLTLGLLVVMIILAKNIQRTATGRRFVAVRDNDLAAEVMGVNLFRTKLVAFFIGCFFAGIAGWLWAHFYTHISPDQFTFQNSLWYLGMIIVGGMGSTTGAMFGASMLSVVDKVTTDYLAPELKEAFPGLAVQIADSLTLIVFALVVIFFIMVEPRGLYHRFQRLRLYYQLHPFSY
jgi:branched-chain amino acid transport system permease protein